MNGLLVLSFFFFVSHEKRHVDNIDNYYLSPRPVVKKIIDVTNSTITFVRVPIDKIHVLQHETR